MNMEVEMRRKLINTSPLYIIAATAALTLGGLIGMWDAYAELYRQAAAERMVQLSGTAGASFIWEGTND